MKLDYKYFEKQFRSPLRAERIPTGEISLWMGKSELGTVNSSRFLRELVWGID
jgi:hypothetical protein